MRLPAFARRMLRWALILALLLQGIVASLHAPMAAAVGDDVFAPVICTAFGLKPIDDSSGSRRGPEQPPIACDFCLAAGLAPAGTLPQLAFLSTPILFGAAAVPDAGSEPVQQPFAPSPPARGPPSSRPKA